MGERKGKGEDSGPTAASRQQKREITSAHPGFDPLLIFFQKLEIKTVRYSTRVSRYTSQGCIVYRLGKLNIVSCIGKYENNIAMLSCFLFWGEEGRDTSSLLQEKLFFFR